MKVDLNILLIILCCAIVTFIPRILPFVAIRKLKLPAPVVKWLTYIPVCLLTALIVQKAIQPIESFPALPAIDWAYIIITIPTLLTALISKSLLLTVLVGIVTAALVRFIF
ncbi:AzlD domain-containing protein [Paenibacillus sinopodophylli]|uniref:AzlD domain-containing protein n=1 Tax=Paenibacillus sinopodophylli TaxID=1837342 RepID=UPI00110CCDD5|nr:AzlD domain-containing protein [Paenibacillus sinopodophylli]